MLTSRDQWQKCNINSTNCTNSSSVNIFPSQLSYQTTQCHYPHEGLTTRFFASSQLPCRVATSAPSRLSLVSRSHSVGWGKGQSSHLGTVHIWVVTCINGPCWISSHAMMNLVYRLTKVIMACEEIQLKPFPYVTNHFMEVKQIGRRDSVDVYLKMGWEISVTLLTEWHQRSINCQILFTYRQLNRGSYCEDYLWKFYHI